jgi:Gluconate 2-dehydrogenase subunit 3
MDQRIGFTRRRFFSLIAVGGAVVSVGFWFLDDLKTSLRPRFRSIKAYSKNEFQELLGLQLDRNSPLGSLRLEEARNLLALAEVLLPNDEVFDTNEGWVQEYIDFKANHEPGYLQEYRNGSRLLDQMTRNFTKNDIRFSQVSPLERDRLLREYFEWSGTLDKASFYIQIITNSGRMKAKFYWFVLKGMLVDYYSSPGGWSVVGYTNYPGVPGDPREYTRALGES